MKLIDWMIAGRFFVAPWMLLNALFGVTLAGFSLTGWLLSLGIVMSILVAGHYINDWRDYVKGIDHLEAGGSVAKAYTAGSRIIPEGRMTVRTAKISAIGFMSLGCLLLFLAPARWDVLAIFVLGVAAALTYTDVWKPRGLTEPVAFLSLGFGCVVFGYAMVKPLTVEGLAGGVLIGMIAGLVFTIDQWTDIQKVDKVRNLAEMVFASRMRVSGLWWFAVTITLVMQLGFVLIGWLPRGSLVSIFSLPLAHITGIYLDYNFQKGVVMANVWLWLFAGLASLGVVFV